MVTKILAEASGDVCKVDVDVLHKTLLELPAEKYLDLFEKMHEKIYGYPPFMGWGSGGCCGTIEDKPTE